MKMEHEHNPNFPPEHFYNIKSEDGIFLSDDDLTEHILTGEKVHVYTYRHVIYAPNLLYNNSNLFKLVDILSLEENIEYCISPVVPISIHVIDVDDVPEDRQPQKDDPSIKFDFRPEELLFITGDGTTEKIRTTRLCDDIHFR